MDAADRAAVGDEMGAGTDGAAAGAGAGAPSGSRGDGADGAPPAAGPSGSGAAGGGERGQFYPFGASSGGGGGGNGGNGGGGYTLGGGIGGGFWGGCFHPYGGGGGGGYPHGGGGYGGGGAYGYGHPFTGGSAGGRGGGGGGGLQQQQQRSLGAGHDHEAQARSQSSTSSSRHHSHGIGEELSGSSTGQLSLGNSTLRPAAMVKNSGSGSNLQDLAPRVTPLRILLAEDNAINMKVALGILHRFGHNDITTAQNGEQALRMVEAQGGAHAFHLILMDLHMPVMGGLEAVREFRKRYPQGPTKVVAVTADAFEGTRDECMAAGFDGWLPKPFRLEDMVRIIGEHSGSATLTVPPPTRVPPPRGPSFKALPGAVAPPSELRG
ncbi:hypothetical protein FOA52_002513 [Chlamydomonas sp. UWO 241]|nr:hypothetical protein FOA52_002513 [Chlamydomonas sp. UWO 241]